MLETLVSSRIRRTLLEHMLAHPDERFYLRGLAKLLNLSVSPVRRELLRLEQLGLLRAYDEANVRFYIVNQTCPMFQQLKQAAALPSPSNEAPASATVAMPSVAPVRVMESPSPVATPRSATRARRALQPWRDALSVVATIASLVAIFGVIVYFGVPKSSAPQRAPSGARTLQLSPVVPTTVQPQSSTSGEMKSSRWRLMPGSIGGGWSQ